MTPQEFLAQTGRTRPAPAYLFVGPENYGRQRCRKALIEWALVPEEREEGLTRLDLDEISLAAVIDDARSLSLFAPNRVIWASPAEAVLPKGKSEEKSEQAVALSEYLRDPSPGVTLVFDAARYDLDGEDKAKVERLREFYAAVRAVVEFPRYSNQSALRLAQELTQQAGLKLGPEALNLLVEALGAEAERIAVEIEKLRLYAGEGKTVTLEEISQLIPDARATTIFALVERLGLRDQRRALEALETLVRQGEYLPLVLTFLATQFRLALVVKEAGLQNAGQMQSHFAKQGMPMWPARAQQVLRTASAFSAEQLQRGIQQIFEADKSLRDARPDDRTIMEMFIFALTPKAGVSG